MLKVWILEIIFKEGDENLKNYDAVKEDMKIKNTYGLELEESLKFKHNINI